MYYPNTHMHERVTQERLQDSLRRAETDCTCREAGIDRRGWTERQLCRLLCAVGRLLISLGHRMEQAASAPMVTTRRLSGTG